MLVQFSHFWGSLCVCKKPSLSSFNQSTPWAHWAAAHHKHTTSCKEAHAVQVSSLNCHGYVYSYPALCNKHLTHVTGPRETLCLFIIFIDLFSRWYKSFCISPCILLWNVYRLRLFCKPLVFLCIAAVCIVVTAFTFFVNKSGLSGTFTPLVLPLCCWIRCISGFHSLLTLIL